MTMIAAAIGAAERISIPDWITAAGVELLVSRTDRKLAKTGAEVENDFVRAMRALPVATHTDEANEQHYELPAAFFGEVLGPHRKYSSCLYRSPDTTLAEAELAALEETVANADLTDGQAILELGCGWGSLSLFMAERFPNSRIVSVSNSASQRLHIEGEAFRRGLSNLEIRTANMVDFHPGETFDSIVSVEMFEHMSNWHDLLERTRSWLNPGGRLFLHVFTHRNRSYRFDHADKSDWIAQHFFTGGIMPAHDLIRRFPGIYRVEAEWRWSGTHYARTAQDWLKNFDANSATVDRILAETYGEEAHVWKRRWRFFFLATAGLFGHDEGRVWGVSHYRLAPA